MTGLGVNRCYVGFTGSTAGWLRGAITSSPETVTSSMEQLLRKYMDKRNQGVVTLHSSQVAKQSQV